MNALARSLATLLVAFWAVPAGAQVSVSFVAPETYADAGSTPTAIAESTRILEQHFKALGARHLRAGETLSIEVLDVDLAGRIDPFIVPGFDIRIVEFGAFVPSVQLRYRLSADGRELAAGHERVADLDTRQPSTRRYESEPLMHEKRMLDRWFSERIVSRLNAQRTG